MSLPFGHLAGDIAIEGEHGSIYIPRLATPPVISLILSVVLTFFLRRSSDDPQPIGARRAQIRFARERGLE